MSPKTNLDEMTPTELAALDFEADKKHDVTSGPLLKIKPLLKLKTSLRAGGSIVGLAPT